MRLERAPEHGVDFAAAHPSHRDTSALAASQTILADTVRPSNTLGTWVLMPTTAPRDVDDGSAAGYILAAQQAPFRTSV